MYFFLNGGYQFDCSSISDVDEDEVKKVAGELHIAGRLLFRMPKPV